LAEHFIRTVTSSLKRNSHCVDRKYRKLIRKALGEGFEWAAEENLTIGRKAKARGQLAKAVCYAPNARAIAFLCASMLPGDAIGRMRAAYREAKNHNRK
jgi:hypothetical protein